MTMLHYINNIATYKGRHSQDPNYSLTEAPRIQKTMTTKYTGKKLLLLKK